MISLDESNIWEKLSSPYGNSKEIPALILELSKTYKKEIAYEIIWEYIYHQGSIYENTLATVPHLLKIVSKSDNIDFKLDIVLSLGILLINLDECYNLDKIFEKDVLNNIVKNRIKVAFLNSVKEFRTLVEDLLKNVDILDESSKIFFLVAYLVSETKHAQADLFKTFSGNDEYVLVCPNCEEETFLWNEENILNAYAKDPVFNKNQDKIKITQDNYNMKLKYLEELIDKINIKSLKPLLPYFKGKITCHNCNKETNVFDGIMNSI